MRESARQGNATHRVMSKENVSRRGGRISGRPFLFSPQI
jgi:hypothetical protein